MQTFKVSTGEILKNFKIKISATMSAIIKTKSNEHEFGFSTYSGICFVEYDSDLSAVVKEDPVKYADGKTCVGLFEYKKDLFIACIHGGRDNIWFFDRSTGMNIVKIENPYSTSNSTALQMKEVPCYSFKHMPYIVVRD